MPKCHKASYFKAFMSLMGDFINFFLNFSHKIHKFCVIMQA